jgi:hypothetical protein
VQNTSIIYSIIEEVGAAYDSGLPLNRAYSLNGRSGRTNYNSDLMPSSLFSSLLEGGKQGIGWGLYNESRC